jgi:phosphate transport system substrate-binding protein
MSSKRTRALRFAAVTALAASALTAIGAAAAPERSSQADYRPRQHVTGLLRSSGNNHMAALMRAWEAGFKKYQPDVLFADTLKGSASGMYGLEMRTADLAVMGRAINPFERYGTYERSWVYPVEIEVATGSARSPGDSPAYAIFVNKRNPLAELSIKQLDGIFGARRGGGWQALSWVESAARPAAGDLRTWGQLGVRGALAGRRIHVYGPPILGAGVVTFFQSRVLQGGAMWNEDLREYPEPAKMIADLSRDPDGIAYAPLAYGTPGVKAVAVAASPGGPFVALTERSVADRSYPLARPVYLDYTIDDEHSEIANPRVNPKVKEFLRYVLSKQGQAAVARSGAYLPLPLAVVRGQLQKLDSQATPPEKALLGD